MTLLIDHLDGIPWNKAPIPRRWHRCWTQSWGLFPDGPVHRCACGAMSSDGKHWVFRNERTRRP